MGFVEDDGREDALEVCKCGGERRLVAGSHCGVYD